MKSPLAPRIIIVGSIALGLAFGALRGAADEPAPIVPKKTIVLFNGKDLSSFYTWLADCGHDDPRHVFTIAPDVDGAPAIHISGDGFGGLITRDSYANYRIVAEFRWGTNTWGRRKDHARDSGILLYCQGEDGNSQKNFHAPWPRSIEFQIIEGGTGDMLFVSGYNRGSDVAIAPHVTATAIVFPGKPTRTVWSPTGTPMEISRGRLDWLRRDPQWTDVAGFRGHADAEKPLGQWNHLEGICDGGHLTYFVNGEKVNEATHSTFRSGQILVQTEGAEVYYRKIELQPLSK